MSLVLVAATVLLTGTGLEVVGMVVGMAADPRFESGSEGPGVHVVEFCGVRLGGPVHLLAILHCLFAIYHRVAQNTYFLTWPPLVEGSMHAVSSVFRKKSVL